jgi:hypothetical protein
MKPPQYIKSGLSTAFVPTVALLSLILAYVASAGPVYYVEQRLVFHPWDRVLECWLQPASWVALRSPCYFSYLQSCATKGLSAASEERMSANHPLHTTPR